MTSSSPCLSMTVVYGPTISSNLCHWSETGSGFDPSPLISFTHFVSRSTHPLPLLQCRSKKLLFFVDLQCSSTFTLFPPIILPISHWSLSFFFLITSHWSLLIWSYHPFYTMFLFAFRLWQCEFLTYYSPYMCWNLKECALVLLCNIQ